MAAALAHEETLAEFLSARARQTPTSRLVLDIVGGLLVGAAAFWARPAGWVALAAAALCLAAYGGWAIIERRLASPSGADADGSKRPISAAQQILGALAVAAFVLMLFALLGIALGPIKS